MPTQTKKQRSEAAKKAARSRKRNERKAEKVEAKTETVGELTIVTRPERKTGEVEIARRSHPSKNEVAPAPKDTPNKATVLPVKADKGGKQYEIQAVGFAPGASVTVHHDRNELRADRAPFSTPIAKGTVADDGTVKVKVPPGFYVLVGKVKTEEPVGSDVKVTRWQYSGFTV